MTKDEKQLIIELIEVIETDVLNGNGVGALSKLYEIKKKLET